jgi:predicted NAD/FAD-dependent oxidoreductase
VLVVGAGMAGVRLAALRAAAGDRVTVVDKGRRHGGRMATRRVEGGAADTGVTTFSASAPSFRRALRAWAADGRAAHAADGSERWRGTPTMRDLPTHLATTAGVPVHLATTVTALRVVDGRWRATLHPCDATSGPAAERAAEHEADVLALTAPAPQAAALLRSGDGLAAAGTLAALDAVTYDATLAVVVRPDGPAGTDGSGVPRTLLADVDPILLDGDRAGAAADLAAAEAGRTGEPLAVAHVHGWRYAQVRAGVARPALRDDTAGAPLILAGDLFDAAGDAPEGIRPEGVERAFHSAAAASRLLDGEGP